MNDLFETEEFHQIYEENEYELGGQKLKIREFTFHRLNANQVWPGNQIFAEYLLENLAYLKEQKVLELGSASGILSIFLKKHDIDITASDCPDEEIFENIDYNAKINGIETIPKLPRILYIDLWGEPLNEGLGFTLIIASDILLYLKSFPSLIKTLDFLLGENCKMWLNNRRRIDTEQTFLNMCIEHGFSVKEVFPKIFEIKKN
ncbi:hypothetical protein SteCoe_38985 [Stentor coeruleus]|uniref:Uncharacterized protein n=1 Tax=Stentor coeruleus TaxID=5963 RepID=A0A1R2AKV9_9CILI|nr:hypothetical protein SteCoe_38985 [Stentor coeruleus]